MLPDDGLKGEVVLVLDRPAPVVADDDAIRAELRRALRHATVKDAAREVAAELGLPRRAVYQLALELGSDDGKE